MTYMDVKEILDRHPAAGRDALIPILQEVQEALGYLSREAVLQTAKHLNLPASKIYGVATFYNQFRFQPKGKHHVQVCRGTACHVKGSVEILETVQRELKLQTGQTSRDGLFSLEIVACSGACGLAPVICINGEFHAKLTPEKTREILQNCRDQELEDGCDANCNN
jgi:NADH:ubiquinone oxidoreductase subunit E